MAIERVSGVMLDAADVRYLVDALDALLSDRTPSAKLADFVARLRRSVAPSGVSGQSTGVDARVVAPERDTAHHAPYDLVDTAQAAEILGVTRNGVRDLARRRVIPAHRAGGRWLYPAATVVARAEKRAAERS